MLLALLLAAVSPTPPEAPDLGQVNTAIWNDVLLNGIIGNGNWLARQWYNAGDDSSDKPIFHIRDVRCGMHGALDRCSFTLKRDGGPAKVAGFDEIAPDVLLCRADLWFEDEDHSWHVKHDPPPPRGGHTRTTMRCHKPRS